ncbi:piggyBac transposable element-derived protein 4-like isoform X2 [Rhinichthys klamathensis goyatoka]|uniref:piggyBac transposable element-derived protein 4-like isoform X2 n=1 Tax=Rhinichthys klamathensis goyatoka TaxID=3034132 RepID=UPI0024B49199|nr:piggyBac transposable element-derived protein 4-like isoform X2 [Rhinichthys klamathensis goyatoka]
MDACNKEKVDSVLDSSEECVNSDEEQVETEEWDSSSDKESVASGVDSAVEEISLDCLDTVLDEFSDYDASDADWNPEVTPRKKKRPSLFCISPSPAKSCRSDSPASVQSKKGKDRKSSVSRSLPFSLSILEDKWKSADEPDIEPSQPLFKPRLTPGPQLVSNASCSPLQYFELFFSKSVMRTILANSNAYGAMRHDGTKKPWQDISVRDFKSFLALVIYMGLLKCFQLTDYWRKSHMYSLPYPAQIMSSRKFMSISKALHLSDPKLDAENDAKKGTPEYDRLFRIKPLYQDIRDACRSSFHPFQNISIDERMVASKAKNGLKQYMKNKPTKWGYKLFVLADSLCGYTWDFFIYEGKMNLEQSKGISYDAVMILANERLLGAGYKLFVDNFYTSPKLFRDLLAKRIWACGTVRANRIGHSKKLAPRGNIRWFREDDLLFVEWKDKRDVLMCSTFHKAFNGDTIKRNVKGADGVWAIQDFPVPAAVLDYNKHMGGVDLSDALISFYTVLHKTRRWYRSFFYHFVDIAVVNAFILHQQMAKIKNQKPLTQKAFREALVAELAGTGPPSAPAQIRPIPSTFSHLPKYISGDSSIGRRKCKICTFKTPVMCVTCDVPLCFVPKRECFTSWHEQGSCSETEEE